MDKKKSFSFALIFIFLKIRHNKIIQIFEEVHNGVPLFYKQLQWGYFCKQQWRHLLFSRLY